MASVAVFDFARGDVHDHLSPLGEVSWTLLPCAHAGFTSPILICRVAISPDDSPLTASTRLAWAASGSFRVASTALASSAIATLKFFRRTVLRPHVGLSPPGRPSLRRGMVYRSCMAKMAAFGDRFNPSEDRNAAGPKKKKKSDRLWEVGPGAA